MKWVVRALTAAALIAAAMLPIGAASADRGGGHGKPGHYGKKDDFRALIFSRTAAFRHTECIPSATTRIAQASVRYGFEVDATENPALFTDANLANYDVVIFLCTTGDVLNATQQAAFERYIQAGGGYAGHPLRVGHRVRLGVVRRARRRLLPRPPGRRRRQPAVPGRDDERRGPPQRRDQAPRADLDARGGVVQLPHQPARHRARAAVGRREHVRPARVQRAGRLGADGRPSDLVVPAL